MKLYSTELLSLIPDLEDFINTVRAIVPPQAREMDQLKYQVQEGNLYARERGDTDAFEVCSAYSVAKS